MKITKQYLRELIRESIQQNMQPMSKLNFDRVDKKRLAQILDSGDKEQLLDICLKAFEQTYGVLPEYYLTDNP